MCIWPISDNDTFIFSQSCPKHGSDPLFSLLPRSHHGSLVVFSSISLRKSTKEKLCKQNHQILEEATYSPEVVPFLFSVPINPASCQQATNTLLRGIFWPVSLDALWVNGKALVVPGGPGRPCPASVLILVIEPTMPMSLGGMSPMATVQAPALLWGQSKAKGLVQLIPCPVLPP